MPAGGQKGQSGALGDEVGAIGCLRLQKSDGFVLFSKVNVEVKLIVVRVSVSFVEVQHSRVLGLVK